MFNLKSKLLRTAILTVVLLNGCGGGGGSGSESQTQPISETPNNGTISKGIVELGVTKGATVNIHTLDGHTLLTLDKTDENGEFNINIEELKDEVQSYDPDMKLVKIISTGGIDTDPNDDGVKNANEEKSVNGEIKSIIPLNTLYSSNGYRVNFITTMVADILEEADSVNIDENYINQIIKKLDVDDIDKDGNITLKDIIFYDMVNNDSVLESNLRTQYLDTFHSGNITSRENIVKEYKQSIGTTKEIIKYNGSEFSVSLKASSSNNYILYGITNDLKEPELKEYTYPLLANNCLFIYQECDSDDNCNNLTKIFFINDKYYYNEFQETMPDVDIKSVTDKIDEMYNKIDEANEKITKLNNNLQNSEERINIIDSEIQNLEATLLSSEINENQKMELIYDSIKMNASIDKTIYKTSDTIKHFVDFKNNSNKTLDIPINNDYSQSYYLIGSIQYWIERLGEDNTIPTISSTIAKDGNKYAMGGSIVGIDSDTLEPNEYVTIKNYGLGDYTFENYPVGNYRIYANYQKLNSEQTVIKTEEIEFEIKAEEQNTSDDTDIFKSGELWNGKIYLTVTSPYTGRIWLDRNLGADKACLSYDDEQCYGDYYQWGRNSDGHEKKDSTTTEILATSLDVGHGKFITGTDWIDNYKEVRVERWADTNGDYICPKGFIVAGAEEILEELPNIESNADLMNNFLKLPYSGGRYHWGTEYMKDSALVLWTREGSVVSLNNYYDKPHKSSFVSAYGLPVRCIQAKKDDI